MFVGVCGEIEVGDLSESKKERLLSKACEMVEVKGEEGRFLVMKYQVTQALWESVLGRNPSKNRGASTSVDQVSWLDCVIFANKMSEKEGLEKVYEISDEVKNAIKVQPVAESSLVRTVHAQVSMASGPSAPRRD